MLISIITRLQKWIFPTKPLINEITGTLPIKLNKLKYADYLGRSLAFNIESLNLFSTLKSKQKPKFLNTKNQTKCCLKHNFQLKIICF
mgnify:FL=1